MVIHPKKEVYIHIPKCGGISITRGYKDQYFKNKQYKLQHRNWEGNPSEYIRHSKRDYLNNVTHNNIHATYDQLALQFPDYKYYTVIRNPLDRWESLYRYNCDNCFVIDWDIITWTKKAMDGLWKGSYWSTAQDIAEFEKAHLRLGGSHFVMYKPAWCFYREPEVEVHRLEDQTIWNRLELIPNNHHESITKIAPYNREAVKEIIYDYYKRDFERWQTTE